MLCLFAYLAVDNMIWTLILMVLLKLVNLFIGFLPAGETFPPSVLEAFQNAGAWVWGWNDLIDVSLALHLFLLAVSLIVVENVIIFIRFLFSPHTVGSVDDFLY